MPFSSRIEANVLGVRSFQAIGCLRSVEVVYWGSRSRVRGSPQRDPDGFARRLVPPVPAPQGRTGRGFGPFGEALGARELPGAHGVEQRARARPAHLALRVEAPATGERETAPAVAPPAVGDAK